MDDMMTLLKLLLVVLGITLALSAVFSACTGTMPSGSGSPGTSNDAATKICQEMVPDHVPWYDRGPWVEQCARG